MTHISDLEMATSSDEFPKGMKFTREEIEDPYATLESNRIAREKRDMARFGKLGEESFSSDIGGSREDNLNSYNTNPLG